MSSTSVARQTKALRLFVVLATATDNVNENLLMEYLLVHNIFGAFLKVHRKRYWERERERERILLTKREKITNHGLLLGVDWSRDTHNSVKQCVVGSCAAHQLPQARNGQFVCRATQSSRRWTRLGRKCVCVYMTQRECVCVYSYLKTLCIVLATFAMCVSLILSPFFLSFFLSFLLSFFFFSLSHTQSIGSVIASILQQQNRSFLVHTREDDQSLLLSARPTRSGFFSQLSSMVGAIFTDSPPPSADAVNVTIGG